MINERMRMLLHDIANDFADHKQPFTTEWLRKNNVTLDEVDKLCDIVKVAIRGYVEADRMLRIAVTKKAILYKMRPE